ncbi:unnamed protein product [Chrysodeixis includens]|uniref:Nose resistant-to-fluoxetine protein N-terminal domain-containing protein n=1 Tax=Chrysodeixis includens TaxID=689277 RepID=A0A9P0BT26_CHRIL|nr:unnamed protein product [Chrysodeixis includens]
MLTTKVCLFALLMVLVDGSKLFSRHVSGISPKKDLTRVARRTLRSDVFDNLFNVYDPSFLALVWPKITNGMHILVDYACWDDLGFFFRELSEGRAWAYNVLDASGRYKSGLFSGQRFWLGSKEQCLRLDNESMKNNRTRRTDFYNSPVSRKKYFDDETLEWRWSPTPEVPTQIVDDRWPPYRLAYTTVQMNLNVTKINLEKMYDVTLGLCMPYSCSARDVTSVINFSIMINDNLKTNKTASRTAKIVNVRRVPGHYDLETDTAAILLICITTILVTLVTAATVVDLDLIKCLPYGRKSMTFDLEKYNTDPNRHAEKDIRRDVIKTETDKLGTDNVKVNYMAVENMMKCSAPTITLDVNCAEKTLGSCKRCGKYRKQCSYPRQTDNLPPCPRQQYNSFASLSTESKKKSVFCRLLLCFSLAYCWRRIFNTNMANKNLSLIHAMRIVATFWIMFIHTAVIVAYISDSADDVNNQNNIYYIMATGTIAFDTSFFVSGLFSSHHFFFLKSQYSVKELVGFRGACGQLLQFVCFVTNRVIRLLPSYGYAVLLSAVLARASQATSALVLPDREDVTCRAHGWRNLLYITTIYPVDEQCMQISWYMSTETQLHMAGALLCAASFSSALRARICAVLAVVAILSSTVADASNSYFDFAHLFTNTFGAYWIIIARPLSRVSPYFLGVFTGWVIHIIQGKLKVSKMTSSLLWVASLSFMFVSCAVPLAGLPWLAAWLHLTWPVALLWPVLMGTTNLAGMFRRLLSCGALAALSRLCYGALLLHAGVARAALLATGAALCPHTMCIWLYFAGTAVLTILASLALSLLVEMPCCSLLRRLSDCAT